MWKYKFIWIGILMVVGLLAVTCAPKPAPTPVPGLSAPAAPTVAPALPGPSTPQPIGDDAAWQEVVAAAKREGAVTIYTFWGPDTQFSLQQMFKQRYGIKLEFITGRGAEHVARLLTERRLGKMVADIIATAPGQVMNAQKYDLIISLADLPVLREKDVWLVPPDGLSPDRYFLCLVHDAQASAINTKLLNPSEAPRSYKDLISPSWKGRMIASSPVTFTGMYSMFVPLLRERIVDMDFMKALGKQDISFQISNDEAFMALARGERPFLIDGATTLLGPFIEKGAPIKAVTLEEGTTAALSTGMAVIKGAPHPNAAKLFANWMLSREGQDIYAKSQASSPVRKDVPDYTPLAAQITPKKLINTSVDDLDQITKMFNDKVFPKLWEK